MPKGRMTDVQRTVMDAIAASMTDDDWTQAVDLYELLAQLANVAQAGHEDARRIVAAVFRPVLDEARRTYPDAEDPIADTLAELREYLPEVN